MGTAIHRGTDEETAPHPVGYTIDPKPIGGGGWGHVYRVHHKDLQEDRALKILHRDKMDERAFLKEARFLAKCGHQDARIVRIHEYGRTRNHRPYLIMELVKGVTITDFCSSGRAQYLDLFADLCAAASVVHKNKIVHCDIKPSNVLVSEVGGKASLKLIDFGIATGFERAGTSQPFGTPSYMSPEQAQGGTELTPASDVYSLGVLLYELVTRRLPLDVRDKSRAEARQIICYEVPPKPTHLGVEVDEELEGIIMRALEKNPRDRFRDAGELADALRPHCARGTSPTPPQHSRWATSAAWAVAAAVMVVGVLVLWTATHRLQELRYAGGGADGQGARTRREGGSSTGGSGPAPGESSGETRPVPELSASSAGGPKASIEGGVLIVRRGQTELWRETVAGIEELVPPLRVQYRGEPAIVVSVKMAGALNPHLDIFPLSRETPPAPRLVATPKLPIAQDFFPRRRLDTTTYLLGLIDTDGRDGAELYWIENGGRFYPSWVSWWDPTKGEARRIFFNSGYIYEALPHDLDGDHREELILRGVNNRLGHNPVIAIVKWVDTPEGVPVTQCSPDLEKRDYLPQGLAYIPLGPPPEPVPGTWLGIEDGLVTVAGKWRIDTQTMDQAMETWRDLGRLRKRIRYEANTAALGPAVAAFLRQHAPQGEAWRTATTLVLAEELAERNQHQIAIDVLQDATRDLDAADIQLRLANFLLIESMKANASHDAGEAIEAINHSLQLAQSRNAYDHALLKATYFTLKREDMAEKRKELDQVIHDWSIQTGGSAGHRFPQELLTLDDFCTREFGSPCFAPTIDADLWTPWTAVLRAWVQVEQGALALDQGEQLARRIGANNIELAQPAALLQAFAALQAGDTGRARELAKETYAVIDEAARTDYGEYPWLSLAAYLLGKAHLAAGNHDEARTYLDQAARLAPACWWGEEAKKLTD